MSDHTSAVSVRSLLQQVHGLHAENTQASFREALTLARRAAKMATPGSYDALLASGFVAVLTSDYGFWKETEQHVALFLQHYPSYPAAKVLHPWVVHALANVCRHTKRRKKACVLLRDALPHAEGEIAERMRLTLVWTLCEAGKPREAKAELPASLQHMSACNLDLVRARLSIAEGNWLDVEKEVNTLLSKMASSPLYDQLDIKNMCDLLRRSAEYAGYHTNAVYWRETETGLTVLGIGQSLANLEPPPSMRGGERIEIPHSPSGPRPAGHNRPGTLGTVG